MPDENCNYRSIGYDLKYIEDKIKINVRFSEVDAMGVVWHGNYLKFFEDGREAFGEKYGLSYLTIYNKGYVTPVVKTELQFKSPISFGEVIEVITRLVKVSAAKMIFTYRVHNLNTGKLSAVGMTEQVFLDRESGELELYPPAFYEQWLESVKWTEE